MLAIVAALLLGACAGGERAGDPAPSSRAEAGGDPLDPEAPGLTDLARLSRYVFREMKRRGECAPAGLGGRVDYTLELVVEEGRIRSAGLVTVSSDLGGFRAPLLPERWPPSLVASIECLEPHLRSLSTEGQLRDGRYQSRFSLGGPAEAPRASASGDPVLPDPAEPGLPDMQRIARHLFREMHRIDDHCSLRNPLSERLGYVIEVEVRGGAIERAELTRANAGSPGSERELPREAWPEALEAYAECLPQHLRGLELDPPPADGVYRPDYALPPER